MTSLKRVLTITHPSAYRFQENLLRTMQQIERSYFDVSETQRAVIVDAAILDDDTSVRQVVVNGDGRIFDTKTVETRRVTISESQDEHRTGKDNDNTLADTTNLQTPDAAHRPIRSSSAEFVAGDPANAENRPAERVLLSPQLPERQIKSADLARRRSASNTARRMSSVVGPRNVMYICDRGVMDATAFISTEEWDRMKAENDWNDVDLRDNRYDQIVHMQSAAIGAEDFYTTCDHTVRSENKAQAAVLDNLAQNAWVGHPCFDVIDNSTNFEMKIQRLIQIVCKRLGIFIENWPAPDAVKRKFILTDWPDDEVFPDYEEFNVIHDYLVTPSRTHQARIRRRGQKGCWTYTHTIRRPEINGQRVELKRNISAREYQMLRNQKDESHATIYMVRRCFIWNNQYFKLDQYVKPRPVRCEDLYILSTHTHFMGADLKIPDFLTVEREITDVSNYSMFYLSRIEKENPFVSGAVSDEFHDKSTSSDENPQSDVEK